MKDAHGLAARCRQLLHLLHQVADDLVAVRGDTNPSCRPTSSRIIRAPVVLLPDPGGPWIGKRRSIQLQSPGAMRRPTPIRRRAKWRHASTLSRPSRAAGAVSRSRAALSTADVCCRCPLSATQPPISISALRCPLAPVSASGTSAVGMRQLQRLLRRRRPGPRPRRGPTVPALQLVTAISRGSWTLGPNLDLVSWGGNRYRSRDRFGPPGGTSTTNSSRPIGSRSSTRSSSDMPISSKKRHHVALLLAPMPVQQVRQQLA